MPQRINGTGTTISPMPAENQYAITMHWITLAFIPVIPLGWQLVKGLGGNHYRLIKELTISEAKNAMGIKGMILTIAYGFVINILTLIGFFFAIMIIFAIRSH